MNTGKRAPLYKVKVHTAGELAEKAKDKPITPPASQGNEKVITKSRKLVFFPESLEKGKTSPVGTRAVHGGKKVVKTAQGWKPVGEDGKQKKSTGAPKMRDNSEKDKEIAAQKESKKKEQAEKRRPLDDKLNEKFPTARVGSKRNYKGDTYIKDAHGWYTKGELHKDATEDQILNKRASSARVGAERIYNGRVYKKTQGGYGKDDKYWKDVRPATEKDRTKIQRVEK